MRLFWLLITISTVSSIYTQNIDIAQTSPNGLVQNDARRPGFIDYSLNLLVKMDRPLTLKTMKNWNIIFWIFGQYKSDNSASVDQDNLDRLTIFNVLKPTIRNSTIRSQFMCSPTEQECTTLTVPNFGVDYLGTYSYQAQVESAINNVFVDFNISAYIGQLNLKCGSSECDYDEPNRQLTVVSGQKLTLECSIIIAQNSLYKPAAELAIWSDMNQFGSCSGETKIEQIAQSEMNLYLNKSSTADIFLYKLSKKCDRTFSKEDIGKNFKCELKPVNQSAPVEIQKLDVLESLSNKVDVHYPPEYIQSANQQFNRTLIAGQAVSAYFTCPFESNPAPIYEWRLKNVVYNNTDSSSKRLTLSPSEFSPLNKDFQIPKDLEVGFYQFQCRAKTEGLINKMSDIITFNLNVIAPPVSSKKAITLGNKPNSTLKNAKSNTGAIIGGVIGGVAALVIIALLVLFIIRRTKNTGSKDELEKAKDKNNSGNNKHDRNNSLNVVDEHRQSLNEFEENSSLAANKVNHQANLNESSTTDEAQDVKSELPILEIKHSLGEISPKRISELTSSATDFVFSNSNPNINATSYRVIPGTSSGFYSPSTAEARSKDAAAKDSNLSNTAKLIRKQQQELGSSSLGSITGGIRVLPSPKLFNKSP